jgi:hypothetical protein
MSEAEHFFICLRAVCFFFTENGLLTFFGNFCLKNLILAQCQWLTPIILATQETEIRRIAVQSQTWQNTHRKRAGRVGSR